MLEIVEGFPEGVVAIAARQHVFASDYDNALLPQVEEALETRRKIRLYYEMDNEFFGVDVGSVFKYLSSWARYLRRWERIAVVTSSVWVFMAMSVFRLLMPRRFRIFTTRHAADARGWITAPNPA
ncbi:MAG: STAS/SEC14 domain-containing protein [Gammaproteobacteria bacterium]